MNPINFILILSAIMFVNWNITFFIQTFFHHRYSAHGQFTMSAGWERFFGIMSLLLTSGYLSPRAYGLLHRWHHAFTDTPQDPHSPKGESGISGIIHFFWKTRNEYQRAVVSCKRGDVTKFTKNLPQFNWVDKVGENWVIRLFWITTWIATHLWIAWQVDGWWAIPTSIVFALSNVGMAPIHGFIINWLTHKYGYRNHDVDNTSTNLAWLSPATWGESLHNNHHKHPDSINFAERWFEIDQTSWVVKLFNWIGIIKIANP
ncbi:MAG: fatty acid desaturase [Candidatus Nomurabacteria bacterium]|nr:fatty acid desaturase [Candidatus Nomurabacteria bacterium]